MKYGLFLLFLLIKKLSCWTNYTIHLIPHSHIDVGWGMTINHYYTSKVINIYNTIYQELLFNTNRTFVICEIIYFKWWYYNQTDYIQESFKTWSKRGRIEFVGGGLVMNDEANPSFQDIIDNYETGFEFLKAEFNIRPQTGWFLDPFGHSAGNSYLMSKLGFKQNVMNRIDIEDKRNRVKKGELEFIWKPFNDEGILTHITPMHYDISGELTFLFRNYRNTTFINKQIEEWAHKIMEFITPIIIGYQHNQLQLLIGHDFSFQRVLETYPIIDAITSLENYDYKGQRIKFVYSTPSKYFEVIKNKGIDFPLLTHFDFFPLKDHPKQYWTGYYTSRPYLKGIIKHLSNNHLVSSKIILESLLKKLYFIKKENSKNIIETIGIMQHHDTITGTSNEYVSNDYIQICNKSIDSSNNIINKIVKKTLNLDENIKICYNNPTINFGCDNAFQLNQTNDSIIIALFNPLIDDKVLITIEFLYSENNYEVFQNNNDKITTDFYCLTNVEFNYNNKCFLSFFYEFHLKNDLVSITLRKTTQPLNSLRLLPHEQFSLFKERTEGLINSVIFDPFSLSYSIKMNGRKDGLYNVSLIHGYYPGRINHDSNCEIETGNNDGMYIFSPCTSKPIILDIHFESSYVFDGDISTAIILNYDRSHLIATFYSDPSFIKVDSLINPMTAGINFALIMKSDIKNNITLSKKEYQPEFWTDSNGMQMMKRIKQFRDTFPLNDPYTIAGNFYPVTHAISIRQKTNATYTYERYSNLSPDDRMITIYNDRPQAGASLQEGEIILLISRTSKSDDNRGIGSALYETKSSSVVFKVQHIIMLGRSIYKYERQGYQSMKFMYNFFVNTPIIIKVPLQYLFQSYSLISEIISVSNNIITNFLFEHQTRIRIQFYCIYDYYFNHNSTTGNNQALFGLIKVTIPNEKYFITLQKLNGEVIRTGNNSGFERKLDLNDFLVMILDLL